MEIQKKGMFSMCSGTSTFYFFLKTILKKKGYVLTILTFLFVIQHLYAKKKNQDRPNVVLILADDMGYHMSAAGTPAIKTPNLDRLIKHGTSFSNAFSVCASCSPSRSSILTGMYPHSNGHWRNTFGPELNDPEEDFSRSSQKSDIVGVHDWVKTLPEVLNDAGYYTAIMRKFHLSFPYKYPFRGKFATPSEPEAYYQDVLKMISEAGDQPFFIQANLSPPHRPFKPSSESYSGKWPHKKELEVFAGLPDIDPVREDLLYYYVSVMFADQLTGSILDALEAAGKSDKTLVIFTSDHGPAFHRSKASAYYAGSHVPLIFSGKGINESKKSSELVSMTDLAPTILDYLGLQIPEQVQGKSLLSIVSGKNTELDGRDYIFTIHNSHGPTWAEFYPSRAIFDGEYYLIKNLKPGKSYLLPQDLRDGKEPYLNLSYQGIIENADHVPEHYQSIIELETNRPSVELYDMTKDPGQMHNVYGLPKYEVVRKRLEDKLEKWQLETGDTIMDEMIESFGKPIPFLQKKN